MEPVAYLWHCQRMGWLTISSQYSTDFKSARQFSLSDAITFAQRHNDNTGIRMLVIRSEDLEQTRKPV